MNIETILDLGIFQLKQAYSFYDMKNDRIKLEADSVIEFEIQRVDTGSSVFYVLDYGDSVHQMHPCFQHESFASVLGKASSILDMAHGLPVLTARKAD